MAWLLTRQSLLIGMLLALAAPAWAQTWPNEPPGSTIINDWNWDSCPGGGWQPAFGCGQIVSDATAPLSPSNVMQYTYNPSTGVGGGDPYLLLGSLTELYIGLWVKPSNPFIGYSNQLNKVFTVWLHSGENIWIEMFGDPGGPYAFMVNLSLVGVNNCHLNLGYGDCPGPYLVFPHLASGATSLGSWQLLEVYYKISTTATSKDGIVRVWLGGTKIIESTAVNTPQSGFSHISLTPAWAGPGDPVRTHADTWLFDHVHVSTCSGCSPAPGDQDGDGIPDSSDQCPTIPGPGPTGCPAPTDTIAPMPPGEFTVTRQGGPITPPTAPTGPSSGGDAGFMF